MLCDVRECSKEISHGNLIPINYQTGTIKGIKTGVIILAVCDACIEHQLLQGKKIGDINVN